MAFPQVTTQSCRTLWVLEPLASTTWAWMVAFILAFLIGISRLYLGAHFVHDVLRRLVDWCRGCYGQLYVLWDSAAVWLKAERWSAGADMHSCVSLAFLAIGESAVRLMDTAFPKNGRIMRCARELCLIPFSVESILTSHGLIVRLAGRGRLDRFSGWLSGLRSDREACSPLLMA